MVEDSRLQINDFRFIDLIKIILLGEIMNYFKMFITALFFFLATSSVLVAHEGATDRLPSPERYNGISASENPMKSVQRVLNICKSQNKEMAYKDYAEYQKGEWTLYGKLECVQVAVPNTGNKE